MNLPDGFINRARAALGAEAEKLFACYNLKPYKGIRVNSLKLSAEEFKRISPFKTDQVEWEKDGFYVEEEKVGAHPYHAAGLYYSQEPSAMLPATLLNAQRGERVLDMCSAPGGKGTQLAQKMQGEGIIVMNEYVLSRAKILSQNVERLGVKNAVVLNESPSSIAKNFPAYFDKILVDAPCSGEGMFRKNSIEAIGNWSEENIRMCAERQRDILLNAAKALRGGGKMVYSTCTFSPEEDEGQIESFLRENPDFSLVGQVKLLPYKVMGEGHYAALLKKAEGDKALKKPLKEVKEGKDIALYREFERELLNIRFNNLFVAGESLYSLPDNMFPLVGLNVLRAGVRLGGFINGRFEPGHSLAMCLKKEECKSFVSLSYEESLKFLHGETLPAPVGAKNGWCAVGIENFPLGLGKISGGIIKNHYPKGLRTL